MAIHLLLLLGAAALGGAGVGFGIRGGVNAKRANDKLTQAQKRDCFNRSRLERINTQTCQSMDELGKNEMEALSEMKHFSDLFERIKNRPIFDNIALGGIKIPVFEGEDLKNASIGAGILLGGLGGAALGTAGAFAASGATTAAVMALGTASTGTAISALSGVAATNATLAVLGGGTLAAGGGGVAFGTMVLGATTIGVGLLVGGIIFNVTGNILSDKADEAWNKMIENEREINQICQYLSNLNNTARKYNDLLNRMRKLYYSQIKKMKECLNSHGIGQVDWAILTPEEQMVVENMVLIVTVLYNMCKVKLVTKSTRDDLNSINSRDIDKAEKKAKDTLNKFNQAA